MDAIERRELLQPAANPGGARDYVITLGTDMSVGLAAQWTVLVLRYVPDRLIIEPETFRAYAAKVGPLAWESLEAVAVAILDDIANELVPRWAQVTLRGKGEDGHEIAIEESQPGWRNEDLIYRLPPV